MEEKSWRKGNFETRHKSPISTISQAPVQASSKIQTCSMDCLQARAPWAKQGFLGKIRAVLAHPNRAAAIPILAFAGRSGGIKMPAAIRTAWKIKVGSWSEGTHQQGSPSL